MNNLPSWVGVAIAVLALTVAYFTYTSQRGVKRIEYVTIYRSTILPARVVGDLQVSFKDRVIVSPLLVIIRMVNTGDRAVTVSDFSTPLSIVLRGVEEVVSVSISGARPSDLRPELEIEGNRINILPTLLNPRDMLEIQVLASGNTSAVMVEGRIADLTIKARRALPYPPGSGPEGELLAFDKFLWSVPEALFFVIFATIVLLGDFSIVARVTILTGLVLLFFVAYPLQVRYLIRRRRMWGPW